MPLMHNLQEQLGCSLILACRHGDQGLEPTHAGIPYRRVWKDSRPGLLLSMALVAVGVRGVSTTDL